MISENLILQHERVLNRDFITLTVYINDTPRSMKLVFAASMLSKQHYKQKSKKWLARIYNNVYEWSDMSIRGQLCQWASTCKIQLNVFV